MAWKKALFLGGAVLLLAACSDAVAPNALRDAKAASAKLVGPVSGVNSVNPASFEDGSDLIDPVECRSGYYVRSGGKDVCLDTPDLP